LLARPPLPSVPAGYGAEHDDQHPGDQVAVGVPEVLELVKLFLFFEV
jgi:hypothetical protein